MAKTRGFLEFQRQSNDYRPVEVRIQDYKEIEIPLTPDELKQQASRCIDCGIPFCHGTGCPVRNIIPEFNDLVFQGRWRQACEVLHATNNLPEVTGRVCPAPCEASCTLAINDKPVTIRQIEYQIVERGFAEGWIKPQPAQVKTGKSVAIIGSGPAGISAAQQLARAGYDVTVFEKDSKPGGLLRYGIPDFKLEKWVLDRRLEQMKAEGVKFHNGVNVGSDISAHYLQTLFDCICITMGAGVPRDLPIPGRELGGIHFAMELLWQQNKTVSGDPFDLSTRIDAKGKNVLVIGGGDTGSDCIGTSRRHDAKSITQIEILPKPPQDRPQDTPWPMWPRQMRTSSSQAEGCNRMWSIATKKFIGDASGVKEVVICTVDWKQENGKWIMTEVPGSEKVLKAELVLLAMGFVHVNHNQLITDLKLDLDARGNIKTNGYQTNVPMVFAAGDSVNGASLVVRAIDSGRQAAEAIDAWFKKKG
jgi:NAD(P)H-dependent glutamate synthase small subunit